MLNRGVVRGMLLGELGIEEFRGGQPVTTIFVDTKHHTDLAAGRTKVLMQKGRNVDLRTAHTTRNAEGFNSEGGL